MGVVSDPHTGPLHARVRELLDEKVLVCLGQDDISDAYYPFGRNNMMEVAFLCAHLLWFTTYADLDTLFDMVTTRAAECIGLTDYQLKVGGVADLVVLREKNVVETLAKSRSTIACHCRRKVAGSSESCSDQLTGIEYSSVEVE